MKQGLIFLAGLGIGGAIGWFASKKYYEKRLDLELEEMKKYYEGKKETEEIEEKVEKAITEKPSLESLRRLYVSSSEEVFEHPVDSDEDDEVDGYSQEELDSIGYEQEIEAKENSKLKPVIITFDDYGELPNYDASELLYDQENDILTDEDGNEVEDRYSLLGDTMSQFAFEDSDEADLYVRNYRLTTDYHVHKML